MPCTTCLPRKAAARLTHHMPAGGARMRASQQPRKLRLGLGELEPQGRNGGILVRHHAQEALLHGCQLLGAPPPVAVRRRQPRLELLSPLGRCLGLGMQALRPLLGCCGGLALAPLRLCGRPPPTVDLRLRPFKLRSSLL